MKCFCCLKEVNGGITINKVPICNSCYGKFYTGIETRTCVECDCTTSINHGEKHGIEFTCNSCLQDDIYAQMDEFLEDEAHKNVPIEDLFQEQSFIKRFFKLFGGSK